MTIRSSLRLGLAGALACAVTAFPALQGPVAATAEPGADPVPTRPAPAPAELLHRSGTHVRPGRDAPEPPGAVSALSWLVADVRTGDVLAAHNAHRKLPPASTLKTLFALTALPESPGESRHKVTEAELTGIGEGSSLVGVLAGQTYRVADLWRGVFLRSGNDAVHVLAARNGGWKKTARDMEAKARTLGARDTEVVSPDGYDAPGQVSSAYDLAVFGRAGLADPEFREYCSTAYAEFPGDGWSYDIQNTNRLLTGADGVGRYKGIVGVKNGYTSRAGHTLVAAAEREGRTLVVSVMNPQAGGSFAVYEEAGELLDWGFAAAGRVRPVGTLKPPAPKAAAGPGTNAAGLASEEEGWTTASGVLAGVLVATGGAAVAVGVLRRRRRV